MRTPHLDRLAARGTVFENAYTPSWICVSACASLATGGWAHQAGCWSSAEPYSGSPPGWAHELRALGHEVVAIGILHYRSGRDEPIRRCSSGREGIRRFKTFNYTPLPDALG